MTKIFKMLKTSEEKLKKFYSSKEKPLDEVSEQNNNPELIKETM